MKNISKNIFSGYHGACHCQGIAVDEKKGYVYYSFTTKLVKSDLDGNIIGSVSGLIGHLGCIDFHEADGKVYGSLEFKSDAIGKGILNALGVSSKVEDAFYCAIFDVDKIDREGMSAEADGIMRAVYLPEVVGDYTAAVDVGGALFPHRYACSGIDGTAWGPAFGKRGGKEYLNICYGIYGDTERVDNDYQVILTFDAERWWDTIAQPLNQSAMHRSGALPMAKSFLYTGNTTYGVQNMEYDAESGNWLLAVYPGKKPQFPNYSMFIIDGSKPPYIGKHNAYGEDISILSLSESLECDRGIYGSRFPLGATGIYSFGNGYLYFADSGCDPEYGHYTNLRLYKTTGGPVSPFMEVK